MGVVEPASLIEKGDEMSCYTRHLGDLFTAAGIEDTKENRKRADGLIRVDDAVPGRAGVLSSPTPSELHR